MPPRDWRLRIEDVVTAAKTIFEYVGETSFQEFEGDRKTVDAVLRNLEMIGEASRHVPAEVTERHRDVPWDDMRDMRNLLIHEYFGVDLAIVWKTIRDDLPALVERLERILESPE